MGVLDTVKVKRKSDGADLVINETDFDPEIHTKGRVTLKGSSKVKTKSSGGLKSSGESGVKVDPK
jgi:hypothetical protein